MNQIILIAHNIRSCHNVGSLLRTAEGIGVSQVWLTGYTPYPSKQHDSRLPHIANKLHKQIVKTALGAEDLISWDTQEDVSKVINNLKLNGFTVAALEQHKLAKPINTYKPPAKIALVVGNEANGVDEHTLALCDDILVIPMSGKKESFNVVQATAMALYQLTFA